MMRDSINEAIGSTVRDMIEADIKVSFSKKELDSMGVTISSVSLSADEIQSIRKRVGVSQSVFAQLMNVSLSSIRQWEQSIRTPSGSTMILLELLQQKPHLLDYRISKN